MAQRRRTTHIRRHSGAVRGALRPRGSALRSEQRAPAGAAFSPENEVGFGTRHAAGHSSTYTWSLAGRGRYRYGDAGVSRPASPTHSARRRFGNAVSARPGADAAYERGRRARTRQWQLHSGTRRRLNRCSRSPPRRWPICCALRGISATGICRCRRWRTGCASGPTMSIAEMVEGLGGRIAWRDAPFDPEIGAYTAGARSPELSEDRHWPRMTAAPGIRRR